MKLSVSLSFDNLDEYRIGLETINSGFLSDKVFEILKDGNIEIVEVILDRVKGTNSTKLHILSEISNIIYRFFKENPNIILYFFCDDLNAIPNNLKNIEPQAYRSQLFSALFSRHVNKYNIIGIEDISICIDSMGNNEYIHFITRSEHLKYIEIIKNNIEEIYIK